MAHHFCNKCKINSNRKHWNSKVSNFGTDSMLIIASNVDSSRGSPFEKEKRISMGGFGEIHELLMLLRTETFILRQGRLTLKDSDIPALQGITASTRMQDWEGKARDSLSKLSQCSRYKCSRSECSTCVDGEFDAWTCPWWFHRYRWARGPRHQL